MRVVSVMIKKKNEVLPLPPVLPPAALQEVFQSKENAEDVRKEQKT